MRVPYYKIYQDRAHEWRWRLHAANHEIVAISGEGYANRYNAERAAECLKDIAANAVYL